MEHLKKAKKQGICPLKPCRMAQEVQEDLEKQKLKMLQQKEEQRDPQASEIAWQE